MVYYLFLDEIPNLRWAETGKDVRFETLWKLNRNLCASAKGLRGGLFSGRQAIITRMNSTSLGIISLGHGIPMRKVVGCSCSTWHTYFLSGKFGTKYSERVQGRMRNT